MGQNWAGKQHRLKHIAAVRSLNLIHDLSAENPRKLKETDISSGSNLGQTLTSCGNPSLILQCPPLTIRLFADHGGRLGR